MGGVEQKRKAKRKKKENCQEVRIKCGQGEWALGQVVLNSDPNYDNIYVSDFSVNFWE